MGVNLKVTTNKAIYDITLEHKYSVIQGDSGTGKTVLATFIEACAAKNKAVKIQCDTAVSARTAVFASIEEFEQFLAGKTGIVVLDENSFSTLKITIS